MQTNNNTNQNSNQESSENIVGDNVIEISVSTDKLKAFLDIELGEDSSELKAEEIFAELKKNGIEYGIKEDKVKQIAAAGKNVSDKLIAEAKLPEKGEDGKLIYHFEEKKKKRGKMLEDGTVDFYSLDLINNVRRGEKIITKVDPVEGKPGINVFGEEIAPPPVKKSELPRSRNTVVKGDSLYAAADGQVVKKHGKIGIKEVYEINGDVDLNVGNIDFVGSVKVKGDVKEGFSIKADGDVEVRGNVGASDINATGNVLIKKGFLGRNKGSIKAGGDFTARFVENGEVTAENVNVHKAIMHSRITARNNVEVTGGKGVIVGGKVMAQHMVEANIIGSNLATKTEIVIGLEPELREKRHQNNQELEDIEKNLDKIIKSLKILKEYQESGKKLPKKKIELFQKLKQTLEQLNERKEELKKENEEIKEDLQVSDKAVIKVNEELFSGVHLYSSSDKMIISNKIGKAVFTEVNKELRQSSD